MRSKRSAGQADEAARPARDERSKDLRVKQRRKFEGPRIETKARRAGQALERK
jgi:hypothetical protein